ncbi:hypothetical protein BDQ17DRAFT_1326842 [Cyathus striatus]|nr:hypothetical protein BDQ17DRAFT_1326842 [Cyathus striatus]
MMYMGYSVLPPELLAHVFDYIDSKPDLLSLRLACRQNYAFLTPRIFHTLKVHPNVQGLKAIEGITVRSPHLARYVQELVFVEDEKDGELPTTGSKVSIGQRMFDNIAKFTSLKSLRLHFHNKYDEPDESEYASGGSTYLRFQRAIFDSIERSLIRGARSTCGTRMPHNTKPTLDLLEIVGMITAANEVFCDEPWQQLLSCLKHLSIYTISPDQEMRGGHQHEPYVAFLAETLPSILIPATNLTSLTLHFDQPAHPNWHRSWDDIHFPNLTALSLTNAVFDSLEDDETEALDGMELFISEHAETLRVLKLHRCWMLCWYDTMTEEPRFWSRVWNKLQCELQVLEEVDVTLRPTPYARLTEWGYMPENCECEDENGKANPGGGQGTSLPDGTPRTRYEEQLDNDREALEQLMHTVDMRKSGAYC